MASVSGKKFLDIQANIECGFTLKCIRDMIRTYSHSNSSLSSIVILILHWVQLYTLGVGIKLVFAFKSRNVTSVYVFLLSFITCPAGSHWYLVIFSTVLESFLMFSWFVLCSLSCLLFPYFAIGLHCWWRPSLLFWMHWLFLCFF